ncbi:MAG: type II toxin-antitoxin system RelE/ParE family toxin [Acidobacteria bacterium]|nr:type II toxin-antitoxin system RelE/ParE family toxin [Acidobacteriota bacterium]
MAYRVNFTTGAARQFRKLSEGLQARLAPHIAALADKPRPTAAEKLKGAEGYRVRVGSYHILYEIQDAATLVLIVRVGHRREVYRKL